MNGFVEYGALGQGIVGAGAEPVGTGIAGVVLFGEPDHHLLHMPHGEEGTRLGGYALLLGWYAAKKPQDPCVAAGNLGIDIAKYKPRIRRLSTKMAVRLLSEGGFT